MKILTQRSDIRYKDFKIDFSIHPVRGDLELNTNEDAVARSIKNLMFMDRYEMPYQPKLGAGLKAYLFENISSITASNIRERIIETIKFYEPRANLVEVVVYVDPDNNSYYAKIVFKVLNNPNPITLDVIFERIR